MNRLRKNWREKEHVYKKWFWRANYPVMLAIYFWLPPQVLLLYTAFCSVYANDETSASAEEAKKAQ